MYFVSARLILPLKVEAPPDAVLSANVPLWYKSTEPFGVIFHISAPPASINFIGRSVCVFI